MVRVFVCVAALAAALCVGNASAVPTALPNLCTLPVQTQIKALALTPTCTVSPVSPLFAGAQQRQVSWGTQGNYAGLSSYRGLGVVVYTGLSAATYTTDFALHGGTSISIGQGGFEQVGPHELTLSTYVGKVGFEAIFQVAPQKATAATAAAFLAFAKAFAAHV